MTVVFMLLLATALEEPRILALRTEPVGARQAVIVLATAEIDQVAVRREGGEVILSLSAQAPADLQAPAAAPPIEGIRLSQEAGMVALRVRVAPEVPYEVQRRGTVLTVLFGEGAGLTEEPAPARSDLAELYKKIFPVPLGESPEPQEGGGGQVVGAAATGEAAESERAREGLEIGALTLRPAVTISYVDADSALFDTPQPVRDHYVQIEPRLGAEAPLGTGQLKAQYEMRFRRGSAFGLVERTSHVADASLEVPAGGVVLRASNHFVRGTLEADEVDPGREFFFGLGQFTRNQVEAGFRLDTGSRLRLDVGGGLNRVRFDEAAAFFDYDSRSAHAALDYEMTPRLTAGVTYAYDRIPPAESRPESESASHTESLYVKGEIGPLLSGDVSIGYRDQHSPRAAASGSRYRGLVVSAAVHTELSPASSLRLGGSRSTQLSAFERNAFYVASSAQAELTLPMPLSIAFKGGAGYHWNEYRTESTSIGRPREDRIFGWSVGLGRPVTRWSYVRADYRRERRDSNLDALDNTTHALIVQLGLGIFGTSARK